MRFCSLFLTFMLASPLALAQSSQDAGAEATTDKTGDFRYEDSIQWSNTGRYAWQGDDYASSLLRDVMEHTNDRYPDTYGPSTMAHETLHGLNAQMRQKTPENDAFVYDAQGRGAYVRQPNMHLRLVAAYVPAGARSLAQNRYQTYLVEQANSWSEVLYIFDEWNAYVIGGRVAVEVYEAGRWNRGSQDAVDGAMDFLYFGAAAMYALSKQEPRYFEGNDQVKGVFAMLVEQSMTLVEKGLAIDQFNGYHARALREHFLRSPENNAIRQFLSAWLGADYTERVLGF